MLLELGPSLFLLGYVTKQVYPADHLARGVAQPVGRDGDFEASVVSLLTPAFLLSHDFSRKHPPP